MQAQSSSSTPTIQDAKTVSAQEADNPQAIVSRLAASSTMDNAAFVGSQGQAIPHAARPSLFYGQEEEDEPEATVLHQAGQGSPFAMPFQPSIPLTPLQSLESPSIHAAQGMPGEVALSP